MPYYPTLDEDLARAKQILAEGKCEDQLVVPFDRECSPYLRGGTIYGKDIYAAHKLLESFVGELERLHQQLAALEADWRETLAVNRSARPDPDAAEFRVLEVCIDRLAALRLGLS